MTRNMTQSKKFQSTLPRRERRQADEESVEGRNFNPRSREGSDEAPAWCRADIVDFNPRSREGSDCRRLDAARFVKDISIHAPAKGATFFCLVKCIKGYDFNPRSREGSDSIY